MNPVSTNILILGAGSEIGAALALCAKERADHRLLLTSRSRVDRRSPPESARLRHVRGIDLTSEVDLLRLRAEAEEFFDGPFSMVHSVGDFWCHKPLIQTAFSEIRSMCESHYLTLCGAAYALLPVMIERSGGRMVAFSCNSVAYNYPDMAPFTSVKAAVETFIKCVAHEYAEHGITATALALPTIRTAKVLVEKPQGDHESYISVEDLSRIVLDVLELPPTVNGNVVKIYKHSRTFYYSGYFERNPRRPSRTSPLVRRSGHDD
jgi:NAD(P)-dependent dehydrogenase (short-subunit alcohol dehydrogenase family)